MIDMKGGYHYRNTGRMPELIAGIPAWFWIVGIAWIIFFPLWPVWLSLTFLAVLCAITNQTPVMLYRNFMRKISVWFGYNKVRSTVHWRRRFVVAAIISVMPVAVSLAPTEASAEFLIVPQKHSGKYMERFVEKKPSYKKEQGLEMMPMNGIGSRKFVGVVPDNRKSNGANNCSGDECYVGLGLDRPVEQFLAQVVPDGWRIVADKQLKGKRVSWRYPNPVDWKFAVNDVLGRFGCYFPRVVNEWREVRIFKNIRCKNGSWVLNKGSLVKNLRRWAEESDMDLSWNVKDDSGNVIDYSVLSDQILHGPLVPDVIRSLVRTMRKNGVNLYAKVDDTPKFRKQGIVTFQLDYSSNIINVTEERKMGMKMLPLPHKSGSNDGETTKNEKGKTPESEKPVVKPVRHFHPRRGIEIIK